jgi:hypothetical protein
LGFEPGYTQYKELEVDKRTYAYLKLHTKELWTSTDALFENSSFQA